MPSTLPDPLLIAAVLITTGLLPFFALMISSYTKIVVVLGLVRQAIGTQQVPSTLVLNGIAIIMSVFIMAPVIGQGWDNLSARRPGAQFGKSFDDYMVVADSMEGPVKAFLDHNID